MTFKKSGPGCPCCEVGLCECPAGGESRKFQGTPTVVITIADMLEEYSFQAVWQAQTFSGFLFLWDTVTIRGLDAWNGTYAGPVTEFKTPANCIDYTRHGDMGILFGLPEYQVETVRRYRTTSTGCVISSTETIEEQFTGELRFTHIAGIGITSGTHVVAATSWNSIAFDGLQSYSTYSILGTQRLVCDNDYNPLLDTQQIQESPVVPTGVSISTRPLANLQKLWIVHTAASRCASPYSPAYIEIGSISAEFVDDV